MQRFLIGVKRFFKNKNTVTVIGLVASLGIIYFAYNSKIQKEVAPVRVPYATVDIGPGELITKDMVSTKDVPGGVVVSDTIMNINDIVGKYASNKAVIPQNSIFYNSTVVNWEDLPKNLYSDVAETNTLVALEVDMESTYGNSIFPGNYIDLYYVGEINNKLTIGKFIESIKVLAVTSANGTNVFEKIGSPDQPKYLIFDVPEDYHLLLRKANFLGEKIFPVPRNKDYSNNAKATMIVNSTIKLHILEQTQNITDDIGFKVETEEGTANIIGGITK